MKKSNKTKLDYQKTHKPDFTAKDLWTNICMNQAGEFVYGFDDREEAKMYADAMKKRRRPVRIVNIDVALRMPLPPTYIQNWNYNKCYDPPKGMFPDDDNTL